jgi:hypothetical protein
MLTSWQNKRIAYLPNPFHLRYLLSQPTLRLLLAFTWHPRRLTLRLQLRLVRAKVFGSQCIGCDVKHAEHSAGLCRLRHFCRLRHDEQHDIKRGGYGVGRHQVTQYGGNFRGEQHVRGVD